MVKKTVLVDATLTAPPRKPKGKTTYEPAHDREEENRDQQDKTMEEKAMKWVKKMGDGVDTEARDT
ncbi:MAG: hypothetical protein N3F09_11045 [Bacteroidia bacterium]|nr:hypothetical protein [Bacteroidia bacterium]